MTGAKVVLLLLPAPTGWDGWAEEASDELEARRAATRRGGTVRRVDEWEEAEAEESAIRSRSSGGTRVETLRNGGLATRRARGETWKK
jgi:hypothetical protein